CDREFRALYFSLAPIPFERDALTVLPARLPVKLPAGLQGAGLPLRHVGHYAYPATFLVAYPGLSRSALATLESLAQLRAPWHWAGIAAGGTAGAPRRGVDTAADLGRARAALAAETAIGRAGA